MKRNQAAIGLSLAIHGALLLMLIGATNILSVTKLPILLTFDLVRPDEDMPTQGRPKPGMATLKKSVRSAPPEPPKPKQAMRRTDPLLPAVPPPVPAAPPIALQPFDSVSAPADAVRHDHPAATGASTSGYLTSGRAERNPGGDGPPEGTALQAGARYLKEHFEYIRIRVLGNIDYPDRARRMNWEGTVLVSFIVSADGLAESITILHSAGYPVLDRSVVEAIHRSVPFPKPPVPAQIVMPVVYRLK